MQNTSSLDDLKSLRNYVLGVTGFATAVSTILIQVFNFRPEPTIACVIAFACMMLLIVYLIGQSEKRQLNHLQNHAQESNQMMSKSDKRLTIIEDILVDVQKSTLRTEICNEIERNPHNHDTIMKMAEKYFVTLKADWYLTNRFLDWAEKEQVKLPPKLCLDRED